MRDSQGIFDELMSYSSREKMPKMKPSERLLKDIQGYGFNMSQLREILLTKGNQQIVSCAGSGKTTSLIFKIIYDLKSGRATRVINVNDNPIRIAEKIWVATFLRTGAEELESSLRKWQIKLNCQDTSKSIQFSTLHAEFKRSLNAMGVHTDIVSASDNIRMLKSVVKGYSLKNSDGKCLTSEDYNNLTSALSFTRNRLDSSRYSCDIYDEMGIGHQIVDAVLRDWKSMRLKKGVCDFEDLQELLYVECYEKNNQEVINFLADRYNYIYLDEFQDTSQIQYELIKVYASQAKQIIAIGDDDQTIYSWRGSDNSIITKKFAEDFNPTISNLSINFRCPSNILKCIIPSIEKNSVRFEKSLSSNVKGGQVRVGAYASYNSMATSLSDLVYEDAKDGDSVAILCRVNSDGLLPALMLDKLDKFSFSVSGDGMTLDSYIGRMVLSIIRLFTERATPAVRKALEILTWDTYCINNLLRACKTNKLSIWTMDESDLTYSCPSIAPRILQWRSWRESMDDVDALSMVLQDYRTNVFSRDTQFNRVARSVITSVESMIKRFSYDSVGDVLIDLEDANERLKARRGKPRPQIKITTVHEFKGKESDSVYVWDDSEDVYPHKKSSDTLDGLEEERRVHYIACTRAKKKCTIMYLKRIPGMFVGEMDLSDAEVINDVSSGFTGSLIKDKCAEDRALSMFDEIVDERNEFWDQGQDMVNRYNNALEEFEVKMRRE